MHIIVFQYATFYHLKGGILESKSIPFTLQKVCFYNSADYQDVTKALEISVKKWND